MIKHQFLNWMAQNTKSCWCNDSAVISELNDALANRTTRIIIRNPDTHPKNFFSNALFPMRFVNNILQFRFLEAGVEFGRFFINTTTTLGFADVAIRSVLAMLRRNAMHHRRPCRPCWDAGARSVCPCDKRRAWHNVRN